MALQRKVLVLDDEKNLTFVVQTILEKLGKKLGFSVEVFNSPLLAFEAFQKAADDYAVILTDLQMPEMTGLEILSHVKSLRPDVPIVIMTAFGTVESAVEALKLGAFDYITKPFDQNEIKVIVEKAYNTFLLRNKEPETIQTDTLLPQSILVGKSTQMQEVLKVIHKVAASPSTVLITGESGTGKELVAQEIHRNSDRANRPFVRINCAAIPSTLIESELFGYEKGAFTGAVNSKPGRFELANEGTLFLDEVADMPLEMQVKLLRVVQEQEFERVGGLHTVEVNVRLIAATNKDLTKEIRDGHFREDLFYRLNVVPIHLAPLRERREDIEDLIYFFVRKFNERLNKRIETLHPHCLQSLIRYNWPGNIRQLENVLERAVLMSESNILQCADLPIELQNQDKSDSNCSASSSPAVLAFESGAPFKDIVKRQTQSLEKEIIERALQENDGNVTRTAEKLGLSRKGLQLKLKELGISARQS